VSDFSKIPIKDRPREKFLNNGPEYLSDQELLALMLHFGTKGQSVLDLANNIIKRYYNFNNLLNCNYEDLIKVPGIKKAKAIQILAIMEIVKRMQKNKLEDIKTINSPEDIFECYSLMLNEEKQENFVVIFKNIKSHVIKHETLFVGGSNCSIVDINLILNKAIRYGACKIICLHNHPSGDPTPSKQDIIITKKINMNSEMLDIKLLDHIIIGRNNYISLKKEGIF